MKNKLVLLLIVLSLALMSACTVRYCTYSGIFKQSQCTIVYTERHHHNPVYTIWAW